MKVAEGKKGFDFGGETLLTIGTSEKREERMAKTARAKRRKKGGENVRKRRGEYGSPLVLSSWVFNCPPEGEGGEILREKP